MKKLFTFLTFLTFTTLISFAQKRVDIYRSGTFFKSYSTIDSAIKAANSFGDSLVLSAHTFYETNLNASSKIIQYQGTISAGDTTTIDAGGKIEYILSVGRSGNIRDIIFQNSKLAALNLSSGLLTDTIKFGGNTIIRNNNTGSNLLLNGTPSAMVLMENVKLINNSANRMILAASLIIKDNVIISNNHNTRNPTLINGSALINAPLLGLQIIGRVKIVDNTTDSNQTAAVSITNQGAGFSVFIGDSVLIKNNRVLTPGLGKGGAISFFPNPSPITTGLKSFKMGAAIFEANESDQGGAIYCEDSSIKLEFNGTIFRGNKAKKGGAIYSRGSVDIKNANFENNIADTGTSIYLNTALDGGSTTPFISATGTRFYNSTMPANKQNHIYATYTPLTAIPPSISFDGNWWGKSDSIGVMTDKPKGAFPINNWAKANWSIKNGVAVVKADTVFPVAAAIRYSSGSTFPANSFAMLKGTFTVDTGTFSPVTANINSSNVVSSSYKTFKDSSSKSANADIVAWIDADTFKTSVLVWSIDTLVSKDTTTSIAKKSLPKILIYPNPATDYINIEGAESGSSIEIYDVMGKLVRINSAEPNKQIVDIKSLPAGIYTLKITTKEGHVATAKVKKE